MKTSGSERVADPIWLGGAVRSDDNGYGRVFKLAAARTDLLGKLP